MNPWILSVGSDDLELRSAGDGRTLIGLAAPFGKWNAIRDHVGEDIAEREEGAKRSAEVYRRTGLDHTLGEQPPREYRGGDLTREAIHRVEDDADGVDDAKHALVSLIEEDDVPQLADGEVGVT